MTWRYYDCFRLGNACIIMSNLLRATAEVHRSWKLPLVALQKQSAKPQQQERRPPTRWLFKRIRLWIRRSRLAKWIWYQSIRVRSRPIQFLPRNVPSSSYGVGKNPKVGLISTPRRAIFLWPRNDVRNIRCRLKGVNRPQVLMKLDVVYVIKGERVGGPRGARAGPPQTWKSTL